ncbi:MAG: hypothetical protein RLZZ301_744 [Bacteroidota bacterium]|jgi:membrane protease YdiL (CAAX protease family)
MSLLLIHSLPIPWAKVGNLQHGVLPIYLALIGFIIFWFGSKSEKIKAYYFKKHNHDEAWLRFIFMTKWLGFFAMGLIPLLILCITDHSHSLSFYGLIPNTDTLLFSLLWTLGLSIIVIPLASFSAKKPKNLINYPQIRAKVWTKRTLVLNLFGWFIYLFGYELMFRGWLLFPLIESYGVATAIAINIALYSATHIPKGLDETLGAIPLGLVLCLLTIQSGDIWIAVLVHVAMSWSNSLTALKHHPDIHYTSRNA